MISFLKAMSSLKYYFSDKEHSHNRIIQFSKLSVIINVAIAFGKIGMGIYSLSLFLCINGLYNVGIASAKAVALKGYSNSIGYPVWKLQSHSNTPGKKKKNRKTEYKYCYLVGIIVFISSVIYTICATRVLLGKHSNAKYSNFMTFVIFTFTVVEITISLQGIYTARKNREPILEAIKLTCLVSSLIALVLSQTAILSYTGREPNIYFDIFGVVFGNVSSIIGLHMIFSMYRIIHGKNHVSIIKKANRIISKYRLLSDVVAVRYEDNGPNERTLYIQTKDMESSTQRAIAEIEEKMNLEVKYIYLYYDNRVKRYRCE